MGLIRAEWARHNLGPTGVAPVIVVDARQLVSQKQREDLMGLNRRSLIRAAGAAALAMPFVAREGFAQAQVLKLTFADTRNHPLLQVLERFAENVKKKSNGALEVQVFGTGELGSQANILTGMQTGIIDLCAHTSGFIDTLFPKFQVLDLPFLFPDSATAEKVVDGPVGKQLLDMMPAKGIYGLGYGVWGWRVTSTINRKIPKPEDIKGLKIRVQPGPIFAATFRALGANPIAIDYSEVYLALSQHTIEAVETPIIALPSAKHYEVVNTVNLTNYCYNAGVMLASKRKFDALAAPSQEILRAACADLTKDWRQMIVQKTDETTVFLKEKGLTINEVDRDAYRKATESVYKDFRDVIGADLVDAVTKQVG
jgi:tripartite ATP-independent transporter DctP family solute receptor